MQVSLHFITPLWAPFGSDTHHRTDPTVGSVGIGGVANSAETARNILAHERLFRLGIAIDLIEMASIVVRQLFTSFSGW